MPVDGVDSIRIKFILKHIPDNKLNILDLGCWDGSYAIRYKKRTNVVYGVESSKTAARKAKQRGILVSQGNFMEMNLKYKNFFDIVVAGEFIEHVFDTDLFLQKIRKLLKPNGKLILTTPNVASLPRRLLLLLGINPHLENRIIPGVSPGHIRYFTFTNIDDILRDNKFRVLNSESDVLNFNNRGTLYSSLIPKMYKKIGRQILVFAEKQEMI